jgi:hypothetical protein
MSQSELTKVTYSGGWKGVVPSLVKACDDGMKFAMDGMTNAATAAENKPLYSLTVEVVMP